MGSVLRGDITDKIIKFKCIPERLVYNSDEFKIYGCTVDSFLYPDVEINKYGCATIKGNLQELNCGVEYVVTGKETSGKYGIAYDVINIKREKPTSQTAIRNFLYEILTPSQTDVLLSVYPDIVDRVMTENLGDVDLSKTKGIKEYTFNVIKQKIIENFKLTDLVEEFNGTFSFSVMKKLYEKYPSVEKIKEIIRTEPYECLCSLNGIGFKSADGMLLALSEENTGYFNFDLKPSYQRAKACVDYILIQNETEGNTYINVTNLKKQFELLTPEAISHLPSIIKDINNVFFDRERLIVGRKTTYNIEKYIANRILEGVNICTKWNYDAIKYRNVNGIDISDEQIKIIENICNNNICILNGAGGTGKSFSTQAVINMLKDNNKTFCLFSPTGKAAKVLSEYTKEQATTIHRGLGYMPPDKWSFNEESKLQCDVVIIDEFSMTDIYLFKKVLEAIDFNKTKLLLIGDNAQLSSVSCGNLLHDFMESNVIPTVTLTKVFRYGEGGLMKVATDVRFCKDYFSSELQTLTWFGENKDYAFININSDVLVKYIISLYKKLLSQGYKVEDIQVLSSYKKGDYGTGVINNELQKVANSNYGQENSMKIGDTIYYKGDLVIQNVNNYRAKLFVGDNFEDDKNETFIANGETGVIVQITPQYAIINFDGISVMYNRDEMQHIGLGYCITIHKSQGSSSKVVILATPKAHTFMLNSNIIYVGLTRMKEKCFHLGEAKTVKNAIKKKANFTRNTFMQNLLKENNND